MTSSYSFARLRSDLREDIDAYLDFAAEYAPDRRTLIKRLSALAMPSVLACLGYRLSHLAHCRGHRRLALVLAWLNLLVTRVSIAPASRIGGGLYIPHPATGIVFQGNAGRNLRLFAGSGAAAEGVPLHAHDLRGAPQLGDDVALGAKAYVAGAVKIGSGARIGFNAFVDRDIPQGARVFGPHVRNRIASDPPRR